jgi:hypothetical protein
MAELRECARNLPAEILDRHSPWVGRSIREAVFTAPEADDLWVDRYAAGYSPAEALFEAVDEERQ